ncbi:MAG: hypothetical protein N2200_00030 [Bacteroidia bacterium]|nr:hypothetical protein [Bacteroidia bacterium]
MRLLFFCLCPLYAQYYTPHLMGTAQTQATLTQSLLSANPAATFPERKLSLSTQVAVFIPAPELAFYSGAGSFSWDSLQNIHIILQQWGFDKLAQTESGIGYALRLWQQRIVLGVRGRLLSTNFSEYGRLYQGTADMGCIFQIGEHLFLGGYGYNLLARGWGFLPGYTEYALGAAYQPNSSSQVLVQLSLKEGDAPSLHTAFTYTPHGMLTVRGGVILPFLSVGGGFSLRYKMISMDMGYFYQPRTGSWLGIGLSKP